MSSLWTPEGEHQVAKPAPSAADDTELPSIGDDTVGQIDPLRAAAQQLGLDLDSMSEEDIAELQSELTQMMQARQQMAQTPAADMLANHLMRLFDLAVIYLEADPPRFGDAATVIESFRAVVDNVGPRLGQNQPVLQEALSQMQMVFVQVKEVYEAKGG